MNTRVTMVLFILVVLALLGVQEVRFRRQLAALRAEQARNAADNSATDPQAAAAAKELPEAVRQLSQARSELATAQHRLNAALAQIATLQTQVQSVAMLPRRSARPLPPMVEPQVDVLGPRAQAARRSWGEEQATGPADTDRAGDFPTAWASRQPDGGEEWLNLEYATQMQLAEVRIRETYNPGAISKVAAVLPNGQEHIIWEGVTEPTEAPVDTVFPVAANVIAKGVKVYLDTRRVPGWNEIDAVELVARDGTRQWAARATASSSYAEQR